MKIKKLEWEEKPVNGYYTNKKYISNKLTIGFHELNFVISHNVYTYVNDRYVVKCFIDECKVDDFTKVYKTLEDAKKCVEEYYINILKNAAFK